MILQKKAPGPTPYLSAPQVFTSSTGFHAVSHDGTAGLVEQSVGGGGCIIAEGVKVTIRGPYILYGNAGDPPDFLLAVRRNTAGDSRNCPEIAGVDFTGHTLSAHLVLEGQEIGDYRACQFDQQGAGHCVRLDSTTAIRRATATNSGHLFTSCGFVARSQLARVLIYGCVTHVVFQSCWFGGPGGVAVEVVDAPDEPGNANTPYQIVFRDCEAEDGCRRVMCRGVSRSNIVLDNCRGMYAD